LLLASLKHYIADIGPGRALKRDDDYEFVLLDEKIHAVETPYACESRYVRMTLGCSSVFCRDVQLLVHFEKQLLNEKHKE
jgi:hypothetical protein